METEQRRVHIYSSWKVAVKHTLYIYSCSIFSHVYIHLVTKSVKKFYISNA